VIDVIPDITVVWIIDVKPLAIRVCVNHVPVMRTTKKGAMTVIGRFLDRIVLITTNWEQQPHKKTECLCAVR